MVVQHQLLRRHMDGAAREVNLDRATREAIRTAQRAKRRPENSQGRDSRFSCRAFDSSTGPASGGCGRRTSATSA